MLVIASQGNCHKQLRKDVELLLSFIDSSVNKLPKDNIEYNTFIDNTEVPGPDNNAPNHKLDQLLEDFFLYLNLYFITTFKWLDLSIRAGWLGSAGG